MKGNLTVISQIVDPSVYSLLRSVCEVEPRRWPRPLRREEVALLSADAKAVLLLSPMLVDESFLHYCGGLRIVACAFAEPEQIDVESCTLRGVWVATTLSNQGGIEAQLEAARNVLDVMSGDVPRGAVNHLPAVAA